MAFDFFRFLCSEPTGILAVGGNENDVMKGKVIGVSLGPGEPDLITWKALKSLQSVDYIFCPATLSEKGKIKSRSLDILRQLPVNTGRIRSFDVPMSRNRQAALEAYDRVCQQIIVLADQGKTVALTAEGDACFYSSAGYLYQKLKDAGYVVEMVAGIPAFIAAGASVGLHIVKQQERLLVVPGDVRAQELQKTLEEGYTVVIMKVPLGEQVIRRFMTDHPDLYYSYFEQVGTPFEYHTTDLREIRTRPFTYFSVLVVRPSE